MDNGFALSRRAVLGGIATLLTARPAAARAWQGGAVSLTYDDGLDCHLDVAAPALERHGLRGTFYVTWENIAARAADWTALARRGHEVANHTMHHPCDLAHTSPAALRRRELAPMERWLDRNAGTRPAHDYAYPCDVTDLGGGSPDAALHRYARLLRAMGIASARTSEGPPNPADWVRRHPYQLQALAAGYDAPTLDAMTTYLAEAQARGRWAILVFHQLGDGAADDGFVPAETHERLLEAIGQMRLRALTVGAAMRALA